MRNGHKGRMACGILELMLGVGLILYICGGPAADRSGCGGRGGGDGGTCDLLYRCNGGSGEA